MTRAVITADSVLGLLRRYPDGVTLPDLIRDRWPDATYMEALSIKRTIYAKLTTMRKFGMVDKETTTDHIQGGHRTVWRAVDD